MQQRPAAAISGPWAVAIGGAIVVSFFAVLFALALVRPLCCADDAGYAVVARSLAEGRGYRSTLAYSSAAAAGDLFDPRIGTGPASILPAAAAIALAGAQPALPGVLHVAHVLALLLLAIAVVAAPLAPSRRAALAALFVLLVLITGTYHLEHWYALLGEVPAALCLIVATGLWARREEKGRGWLAGAACGVAVLHKLVALFGALALPLSLLVRAIAGATPARRRARDAAAWTGGILAPLLVFELWKWAALGGAGWLANQRATFGFLSSQGLGEPAPAALGALLVERGDQLAERFALSPLLALLTLPLAFLALGRAEGRLRTAGRTLLLAAALEAVYWLFLSIGWPRYLYVGLVIHLFAIALAVAATRGRAWRAALLVVTVAAVVPGLPRLRLPFAHLAAARHSEASELAAARRVAAVIRAEAPVASILTENFAQVATLEYLAEQPGRFRNIDSRDVATAPGQLFIVHDSYRFSHGPEHERLLARCAEVTLVDGPYRLYRCR
jgi:hypothetical protein